MIYRQMINDFDNSLIVYGHLLRISAKCYRCQHPGCENVLLFFSLLLW